MTIFITIVKIRMPFVYHRHRYHDHQPDCWCFFLARLSCKSSRGAYRASNVPECRLGTVLQIGVPSTITLKHLRSIDPSGPSGQVRDRMEGHGQETWPDGCCYRGTYLKVPFLCEGF